MSTLYARIQAPHPLQLDTCHNGCAAHKCRCAFLQKLTINSASSEDTLLGADLNQVERTLGDTELSYFLPSRESGVNDM